MLTEQELTKTALRIVDTELAVMRALPCRRPSCGAVPGGWCRSATGQPTARFHAERHEDANALTAAEQAAVVSEFNAGRAARIAERDAKPLTADQHATRDAVTAAWSRMEPHPEGNPMTVITRGAHIPPQRTIGGVHINDILDPNELSQAQALGHVRQQGHSDMNVLLSGVVGSTAYGLAGPDSDVDHLGIYAAPTEAFHGLCPPLGKAATVVRHDPDSTLHEAGKAAALMLGGNPSVTEILWLPADLYEVRTDLGDEVIAIRDAFLSAKRCRDAYFGYATSQFKRLLDTGQFQSKMRNRQSKHGRHLLRLLDQGYALYATGELPIRVDYPQRYIDFGEAVANDPEVARPALAEAEAKFDDVRSVLPAEPDRAAVEAWLLRVRRAFLDPA